MFEQLRRSNDWVTYIADIQMKALPGSFFQYKEWDVVLLSAVISKATHGSTAFNICSEHLYKPLEIKSGEWPVTKCGLNYTVMQGEEHSDLSARDMVKIGLLMLRNGRWNTRQVISQGYIKQVLTPSTVNSCYGYLWWIFGENYGCRGFGGQEINVYPKENAVMVIQATPTPSSKSYGDICENIIKP